MKPDVAHTTRRVITVTVYFIHPCRLEKKTICFDKTGIPLLRPLLKW